LANGWTIEQQMKLNAHKCKLARRVGIILTWWMCQLQSAQKPGEPGLGNCQGRQREQQGKQCVTPRRAGAQGVWRAVPRTFSLPVCIQSASQGNGKSKAAREGRLPFGFISHRSWGALRNTPLGSLNLQMGQQIPHGAKQVEISKEQPLAPVCTGG